MRTLLPLAVMSFQRVLLGSILIGALSAAIGCSSADSDSEASQERLTHGDPKAGYSYLVNGGFVGAGMPVAILRKAGPLLKLPGVSSIFPIAGYQIFGEPGIPGREGPNAGINYAFTQLKTSRGNEVINNNCLSCHTEQIHGTAIVGLGNTTLDFTSDWGLMGDAVLNAARVVGSDGDLVEAKIFAQRLKAVAPHIRTTTVGVNPAINFTWALIAHRDPKTLAWSDTPLIDPPPVGSLPYDVPAWWQMKRRKTDFVSGEIKFHQGIVMLASLVGTESLEQFRTLEAPFADVMAYLRELSPPRYPGAIDANLAASGEKVFTQHCATCHGTYGATSSYPERVLPVEEVGTDRAAADQELHDSQRFFDWIDRSPYGAFVKGGTPASRVVGYLAPPLDGVWATAPYFHNGSVPTLEGVLDSSKRPRFWQRSFDSKDYDIENMGWKYQELDSGKNSLIHRLERRSKYIYDTTTEGYSNTGHTFGDDLTVDDRRALLEYLKTL